MATGRRGAQGRRRHDGDGAGSRRGRRCVALGSRATGRDGDAVRQRRWDGGATMRWDGRTAAGDYGDGARRLGVRGGQA
uniref:Uncharacterized protein n=1 Tax=Oryza sativa subsp. japonica TaxID=39947 RepID=Q6EQF9_ORYSJ|nr:hypothetical protein [Oryza sativa Japonica Group]